MSKRECQCEHEDHFDDAEHHHPYGMACETSPVRTEYGTFHVCKLCADTHLRQEEVR